MSETTESDAGLNFTGPWESSETPGFHKAAVGGGIGPFGQIVSLCAKCGALLLDQDSSRQAHDRFHQQIQAIAKWINAKDPEA